MKKNIYLREVSGKGWGSPAELNIFEGSIEEMKEDKAYFKKYHDREARYFLLKEII
ncbi:MAG TPA: hypothetical protein VIR31_04470 [Nitrososphaeraceae archaeon]